MNFFEIMFFLVVFGSILFIAYVTTRIIGSKTNKTMRGKYITTIETISLGIDKHLHLVKVVDKYVLISSSGKNIEFLTAIDMDYTEGDIEPETSNVLDFKSIFEKYVVNIKNINGSKFLESFINKEDSFKPNEVFKNNLDKLKKITAAASGSVKNSTPSESVEGVIDRVDLTNAKK